MRVLITGGAGFIGSHLTRRLVNKGATVLVIDSLATGNKSWVPKKARLTVLSIDADSLTGHQGTLYDAFRNFKPDVIVHAAAKYLASVHPQELVRTNIFGTYKIAAYATLLNIPMIYLQTSLVLSATDPFQNSLRMDPPPGLYMATKLTAEAMIRFLGPKHVSVLLANVYGPRNLTGPIPAFYKALKSGLEARVVNSYRDFMYIDDCVRALQELVLNFDVIVPEHAHDMRLILSTGNAYSIETIYLKMASLLGQEPCYKVHEVNERSDRRFLLLKPSPIWEEILVHKTPLLKGLEQTIRWYDSSFSLRDTEEKSHIR